MNSQQLISEIASDMGKEPTGFKKFQIILSDNLLDDNESLMEVTDKQWDDIGLPDFIVERIKQKLGKQNEK